MHTHTSGNTQSTSPVQEPYTIGSVTSRDGTTIVRADQFATQTGMEGFQSPGFGNGDDGTGSLVRVFCHETSSFSCKSRQTRRQTRVANREAILV